MKVCRMHYRDYITGTKEMGMGDWRLGSRRGSHLPTEAVSHSVSSVGQTCLHKAKYRHGQMYEQDTGAGREVTRDREGATARARVRARLRWTASQMVLLISIFLCKFQLPRHKHTRARALTTKMAINAGGRKFDLP